MPDLADNINLSSQIDRIIWIAGKFARFSVQYHKNIRAKIIPSPIHGHIIRFLYLFLKNQRFSFFMS